MAHDEMLLSSAAAYRLNPDKGNRKRTGSKESRSKAPADLNKDIHPPERAPSGRRAKHAEAPDLTLFAARPQAFTT